ncbi:hypothetical protein CASFOL_000475 [Castilleja foliolosa]|uniref:Transposase, Ptta/En/Spm, plant n=1 Tax=Castilleja foliolosa TaxID=1961234 RepID=A0ABD3ESL7_9LAMI
MCSRGGYSRGGYNRRISLGPSSSTQAPTPPTPSTQDDDLDMDETIPPTPSDNANAATSMSDLPNSKFEVFIIGKRLRSPSKELPTTLRRIHEKRIHSFGWNFKHIPTSHRDTWWPSFTRSARWDQNAYSDKAIKNAFMISMRESWKSRLAGWKKEYRLLGSVPASVGNSDWSKWLVEWEKPEQKEKSEKARKNRLSEPGGPGTGLVKHRGGSRPANRLVDEILARTGKEPTNFEILLKYHQYPDGTFTDAKSQRISVEYQTTLEDRLIHSGDSSQVDPNDVYLDVVGCSKGRRFGLGCFWKGTKDNSSSRNVAEVRELKEKLTQQDRRIEMLEEENARTRMEFADILQQQVQAAVAAAMSRQSRPFPSSPPNDS